MHDADRPIVRIVDDESAVREALAFLLQEEGWDVRLYSSAEDFLAHDPTDRPGCLVLDVKMPGLSGTELHEILRNRGFAVPILFLSAHGDIDMAVQALQKGAVDFIPKPLRPERVLEAVAKAVQNDRDRRDFGMTRDECRARLLRLTDRERQILRYALAGLSNNEIAEALAISAKTVENHKSSLFKRLDVSSVNRLREMFRRYEVHPERLTP